VTEASLRLTLIQARDEQHLLEQELLCFVERMEVGADRIRAINVLTDAGALTESRLDETDALLIGGSGRYSAGNDYPWTDALLAFVRSACNRATPTFGSCWGHQVIARALGGEVRYDPSRAELGCFEVQLTPEGAQDPLFSKLPKSFHANMGHHDRVTRLPPGTIELAANPSQRFQAFRVEGLPVYGTQFHSELNAERERDRLLAYREAYRSDIPSEEAFQSVLDSLAETTEADRLLRWFLEQCVFGNANGRPSGVETATSRDR